MILIRKSVNILAGVGMLAMSGAVFGSGFALIEQSASGMGNAFAGGAAIADDASTIFFNPAGMSRLDGKQVAVAVHAIKPSAKFTDTGSTAAALQTKGGNGGDAGSLAFVPNAYFSLEVNPQTRVGLGINAPFGLKTEYDADWVGRFQAIKSEIQTINVNPSVSFDVNDKFTFGVGLSYQHIKGDLTSSVNYSALASGALGSNLEGVSTISGTDSAWGYNIGALFNIAPNSRVGVAYRSKIKYTLNGTISFADVPPPMAANPLLATGDVTLPISMPDSFSLSGFRQLDEKWEIMADATWTGWSVLQELKIDRTSGVNVLTVQENWKNTWRVSAGTSYRYNENWKARVGVAFDQSPVSDTYRTARIPDNDRTWIALGGQYKPAASSAIDFGYAHLFVKDSTIADMQGLGKGNLVGNYENSVDILSVQYTHSF
jgi:long-chain fatty acid transport protein